MLVLHNIAKRFADRLLFKDINYHFPTRKRIALIGANGSGKTTLLNIICGFDEPDDGNINKSKSLALGYLPQEPNPSPETTILQECMSGAGSLYTLKQQLEASQQQMEDNFSIEIFEEYEHIEKQYSLLNGYAFESKASKILAGLGFKEEQLGTSPLTLSGGWRMRLELAKILLNAPDVLILDEPTNHLDLPSIVWLETYLTKFDGTVLFVSHDEDLLRKLPQITLHLKDGRITAYPGNFDDFLSKYAEIQEGKVKTVQNIERKIKHASQFVDRFGASASRAKQAQSRLKMIAKLEEQIGGVEIDSHDQELTINIPVKTRSGIKVLQMEDCSIGYTKPLVKSLTAFIERGQKVAIVGANGIGKSTLLKSITGLVPFLSGKWQHGHNVKCAYYSQDQLQVLDLEKTSIENLLVVTPEMSMSQARHFLASFLLKGDAVFKPVKVLSGGEKSRLGLACLLAQDANFLLLDEPTNHLDMASTETLAEALNHYQGTVLFVSHNRNFINSCATQILAINSKGTAKLFRGNLQENDLDSFLGIE